MCRSYNEIQLLRRQLARERLETDSQLHGTDDAAAVAAAAPLRQQLDDKTKVSSCQLQLASGYVLAECSDVTVKRYIVGCTSIFCIFTPCLVLVRSK